MSKSARKPKLIFPVSEVTKPVHFPDHARPQTRREFLARGFMSLSAWAFMPSALDLMLRGSVAYGAEDSCPSAGAASLVPFLVFDAAGGASLCGNFVPLTRDGQLLSSMSTLGLGNSAYTMGNGPDFNVSTEFGAPMAANIPVISTLSRGRSSQAGIYRGIRNTTTPEARANLGLSVSWIRSQSDSNANPFNPCGLIARAGYVGRLLPNGLGLTSNESGGNSASAVAHTARPLQINNLSSLQNALSLGGGLNPLTEAQKVAAVRAMARLSSEQKRRLAGMTGGEVMADFFRCGMVKNQDFARPATGVDPTANPTFLAAYNRAPGGLLTTQSVVAGTNNEDLRRATIVYNVLEGNVGPSGITFGGADYHLGRNQDANADADAPDNIDLRIGESIGRAVQAAHEMGRPLFFVLITDGGISSQDNTRIWQGDSDTRSGAIMGFYRPGGRAELLRPVIGAFNSSQGVDGGSSPIATSPMGFAFVAAYNYLRLNGGSISPVFLDQFRQMARDRAGLSAAQLDSMIAFGS